MATFLRPTCEEGIISGTAVTSPCTARAAPWVLAATIIGSSMVFIDGTVVNVALPVIQEELKATVAETQWIVEAYALLLAALILVGGSLGDHLGRRRVFAFGVGIFTVASVACGLAPNAQWLIAARALQGVGGALLTPTSLAILGATFAEDRRGQAIGTWSSMTAITMALGPVFGGWLIEQASWRWVFFLNIPLAIVVLAATFWAVPESRDEDAARLDWWGALLATAGLGGVVYGLIESANLGLGHPTVLITVALGTLALAAFLVVEARSSAPMIPLGLFRSRTFSGANVFTVLVYGALSAAFFFLPFNLIQVQGYSATAAGLALLPFMLIIFTLSRWSGTLMDRFGARWLLVIGALLAGMATLLYALPEIGGSYWTTFFPAIVLQGIGMAMVAAPLTTIVMGSVEARHTGVASGINNALSRTAGLLAVAVLSVVALGAFNIELDSRLETIAGELSPDARVALDAERVRLAAAEVPPTLTPTAASELRRAIDESFVGAFRVVMAIAGAVTFLAALCAWLLIERPAPHIRPVALESVGHA
jgi:EmrB/QacA subfamily drug resistance transporter